MLSVVRNFPVGRLDYWDAGADPILRRLKGAASGLGIPTRAVATGEEWSMARVLVRVLHPDPRRSYRSLNDGSVVLRFEFGRFTALLAGDLEGAGEADLLARAPDLRSLFLKVAHHGSRSATGVTFLNRVRPRWAAISTARINPFGNPSPEVLARLARSGARLLLTPDHGAVTIETDGDRYLLRSHVLGVLEQGTLPR
jgi:competence protein ComEC